jgi:dolichyl-phosphate-mannose--protein O-mannosyl transferase
MPNAARYEAPAYSQSAQVVGSAPAVQYSQGSQPASHAAPAAGYDAGNDAGYEIEDEGEGYYEDDQGNRYYRDAEGNMYIVEEEEDAAAAEPATRQRHRGGGGEGGAGPGGEYDAADEYDEGGAGTEDEGAESSGSEDKGSKARALRHAYHMPASKFGVSSSSSAAAAAVGIGMAGAGAKAGSGGLFSSSMTSSAAQWASGPGGSGGLPDRILHFFNPVHTRKVTAADKAAVATDFIERNERWVPLLILSVALATRFYRLDTPPGVVFDETHFGRFTNQYHAGTYLFDIHPPLGKIVFWFITSLTGYDHKQCNYKDIGNVYGPQCIYIYMRSTSALYSSATAVVMYYIIRHWGASVVASMFGVFLLIVDNLNLGESRLILMDAQLIFWCALCLLSALKWWGRLNAQSDAETTLFLRSGIEFSMLSDDQKELLHQQDHRFMTHKQHYTWLVWMGFMCAQAVAIKWTGLATPGLIAVETFFAFCFLRKPLKLLDGAVIAGVGFVVYAFWFWCHFMLLPYTGDGDGFMRIEFQRTLVNNTFYDPKAAAPPFLVNFFQLNHEMLSANARIDQRHPWESVWWEWIFNLRGLRYWDRSMAWGYTQVIYLLGNPLVIWLVAACLVLSAIVIAIYFRVRQLGFLSQPQYAALDKWGPAFTRIGYCMVAYALNLLPYTAVNRSCFIYHYMPALLYGEIVVALFIDAMAGRKYINRTVVILFIPIFLTWLHFCPWVYALPLTADGHARRMWMKRWD